MGDHYARGEDYEKKAEKKLSGWGIFGSKYEDAADLFDKAANSFKLAKSWDKAASIYIKLANCHLKSESKHESASSYIDAANCYKKTSPKDAVNCLDNAVNLFMDIGRLNMAARYYKEIAELCESDQNIERAIENFEKAAELFESEEVTTSANQCKLKVAQFAAQLEQYQKAIEIYEEIARHSLNNNLLKYGVKGHLLNAGLCQLCKGDLVAISNALERYQNFEKAAELFESEEVTTSANQCKLKVAQFAAQLEQYQKAIEIYEEIARHSLNNNLLKYGVKGHLLNAGLCQLCKGDLVAISNALERYQDSWKTTLLLRVKEKIKAKELEEDDLT